MKVSDIESFLRAGLYLLSKGRKYMNPGTVKKLEIAAGLGALGLVAIALYEKFKGAPSSAPVVGPANDPSVTGVFTPQQQANLDAGLSDPNTGLGSASFQQAMANLAAQHPVAPPPINPATLNAGLADPNTGLGSGAFQQAMAAMAAKAHATAVAPKVIKLKLKKA